MEVFRPTKSAIFPENGLEIPAEIVKRVMIKPFNSELPRAVKKPFNSGMIRLKLIMKKNMLSDINQKLDP